MTPEELRKILRAVNTSFVKTDSDGWKFYMWRPGSWGIGLGWIKKITSFTDEELMAHYARFLLERES